MVHHQKQYSTMGMIDDKQNVKVKEGGGENMNRKEKKKQNKEEGDKKKEEKKMTKYREEKERTRGNDKDNEKEKEKEDQRKRKENEKKKKAHKEREEDKETDKEEEESKERDAKEQNDKKHCPQFFRSLTTSSSMDQVTIPEDFHKYLEECTGVVSLRGPSGHLWPVELAKISGELCFAHGWKEFLCDHRIVYGYHLVFRYDGKSQFSVTVFLPSSCEAPYAFLAQPRRMDAAAVAAEDENGHTGTNADGTAPQEEDSHIGSGADGTPQNEGEEEDASEEYEGSDNMSVDADSTGPQEEEEDTLSENPENEEDSEWGSAPSQQQKEDRDKIHNGFVVGKRTRFRKVDDIMTEVVRSKKSKAKEGKRHEALSGDSESEGEALGDSLAKSERRPPRKSKADEWKRPEAPSELVHCPPKKSKAGGKRSTALASKGAASSDSLAESERRPPRKSKAAKRKRPEAPCGHSESEGAESGDSLAELVRRPPKKSKAKGKRSAGPSASKGMTSSDSLAGVFAPESICKDLTTLHKSFGNKHSMEAQFPMFNKSNNSENEPGRVVIKVKRMPELKSQRRPVTQRDKEDAMNRVRRFQSERPFVIKEMNHTNVYASGFMIIPDMFVENFLPKDSRKMTLWDPQAKPWKVWYEYTGGECPRAAFSAGWGALAMENNLEKWDVCIFELLDQNYNVKLHVYRAVLEITPCVIAPKHRPQGCA